MYLIFTRCLGSEWVMSKNSWTILEERFVQKCSHGYDGISNSIIHSGVGVRSSCYLSQLLNSPQFKLPCKLEKSNIIRILHWRHRVKSVLFKFNGIIVLVITYEFCDVYVQRFQTTQQKPLETRIFWTFLHGFSIKSCNNIFNYLKAKIHWPLFG